MLDYQALTHICAAYKKNYTLGIFIFFVTYNGLSLQVEF